MLDQDAKESLKGAEDRAMEHDGPVTFPIFADIGGVKAFG